MSVAGNSDAGLAPRGRSLRPSLGVVLAVLCLALVATAAIALTVGAAGIPFPRLPAGLCLSAAPDTLPGRD